MAYTLDATRAQLITVDARLAGQTIINRFWLAYMGVIPNPDVARSDVFLTQFRAAYRTLMGSYYSTYTVFSYEIKEMSDALQVAVGPPSKWRAVFDVDHVDTLLGVGADVGALAPGAGTLCPAHEALRVKFVPATRSLGYFKSNYVRVAAGFPDTLKDTANREKWTAGTKTTYDGAFGNLLATNFTGVAVAVGVGYFIRLMSVPYFGRVQKPVGGDVRLGTTGIGAAATSLYIGTQTTRRYSPSGIARGV